MMNFILLGIIQGLTEFLPVSSSGHLVIFQHLLKIEGNVVFLDIVLHLGTLCSLLVFFREDLFILCLNFITSLIDILFHGRFFYIWRYDDKFRLCIYLTVTTFITGCIGVVGQKFFEQQFESVNTVIIGLFVISLILFMTRKFNFGQRYLRHLIMKDSIFVGFVQALAIIPGISRSGATISALLFRNIDRESAFKFSFLVSIPAILGAFVYKLKDIQGIDIPMFYLVIGFLTSFVSGLAAIYIVRSILKGRNFYKFSYYCFTLALIIMILRMINIL